MNNQSRRTKTEAYHLKLLKIDDVARLEKYLAPHRSECMFICSNLKAAGIEYKGSDFQGEYWGCFRDFSEQLYGVIVHYWNGNVMMYASDTTALEQLVIHLKNHTKRFIAGVLGPNMQAEYVIKHLGLSHVQYNINSNEGLYEIDLEQVNELSIPDTFKIVEAKEVSRDLLIQWMEEYEAEALGSSKNSELYKKAESKADGLRQKDCWVLIDNNVPVSLSAFNARLEDIVQVGPVWTPLDHRNKGFAKLLLRHTLVQEKRKGTKKALLFTDNPVAIKVYQFIGFKKIGDYRLALLKEPVNLL